ncbi:MAG: hypothetical protein WCC94_01340 [Candidatus Bathyarchaeia archaeon]
MSRQASRISGALCQPFIIVFYVLFHTRIEDQMPTSEVVSRDSNVCRAASRPSLSLQSLLTDSTLDTFSFLIVSSLACLLFLVACVVNWSPSSGGFFWGGGTELLEGYESKMR